MALRKTLLALVAVTACISGQTSALAQDEEGRKEAAGGPAEAVEMPPTELDLPVDESIKVKVDPIVSGPVVERVVSPTAVMVGTKNTTEVEVFVVPVDAPYGGRALEKPHSVGKDDRAVDGFKVMWTQKETAPYVKVFAVVTRKTGFPHHVRSRTFDFGMGGTRLDAQNAPLKK